MIEILFNCEMTNNTKIRIKARVKPDGVIFITVCFHFRTSVLDSLARNPFKATSSSTNISFDLWRPLTLSGMINDETADLTTGDR